MKLKYIQLKINEKKSIAFTDNGDETNIYDLIDDALGLQDKPTGEAQKPRQIMLKDVEVKKATINIIFRKMPGDSRIPSVTFDITVPHGCTLKDTPLELIAQRYIEKWDFIVGDADETEGNDETTDTTKAAKKKSA